MLPEMWCIKSPDRTKDNIINAYARATGGSHWTESVNNAKDDYLFIAEGKYIRGSAYKDTRYSEISFEDFKLYVLKQTTEYLITN